ncbi:MAG: glutamine--tRNA ligase/YqeY domain fusion protein [Trueperaceae bacterium]|nr:glutamine--tRNA ligase/YqeY domain fusion protein [Trueperaceae bacterium]MCO5173678.1 glutamine--tRNA ligase/YqeY domain fusion protein [Trueperaceae bacterium]MCW5819165.1 glutamine--tRNA ligase/YqeY domain fusion protein [Trueperaceae bacterium]
MEANKSSAPAVAAGRSVAPNFVTDIIDRDIASGAVQRVVTRFPPEPNGYLHIGHAKAICLDFGVASDYGGITYLRFDDTNPVTEDPEYVEAIQRDVRWLGFEWHDVRHASDYFAQLHEYALRLIEAGDAYVDSLTEDQIREYRGSVTEPGRPSPFRDRSISENVELFARMRAGEFGPGEHVLRAKIDMAAANMKMRDPILYRIVDATHYRTGNEWAVYPMYDFAHPLSDAIEGVTHSLCTLEFENNRDIYDWLVERLVDGQQPHQYEFARLVLDYTVVSKRKLIRLVREGVVNGWDDPRMPTISALRRKGVRPEAIREFTNRIGVAKANSRTDLALLDSSVRDDLNAVAPRVMAVLEPLKLVLTNLPEGTRTELDAPYWPPDVPGTGSRKLQLTREVYIERSDFAEEPSKGFKRLAPGRAVRLRHGYVVRLDEVVKDAAGEVVELRAHAFTDSLGTNPPDVKVWAALHWVSASDGVPMTARLFERLFTVPDPDGAEGDFLDHVNPDALREVRGYVEPSVLCDAPDTRYQFERVGYFWRDPVDDRGRDGLVFNRIVPLKDARSKQAADRAADAVADRVAGRAPHKAPGRATGGASEREAGRPTTRAEATTPAPEATRARPAKTAFDPAALSPAQRERYVTLAAEHGLGEHDAAVLAQNDALYDFFARATAAGAAPRSAATWVVQDVARLLKDGGAAAQGAQRLTPEGLAELTGLVDAGTVTVRVAKELFAELVETGASPAALVAARGLERVTDDGAVLAVIEGVLTEHPAELAAYRGGKAGLAGFFIGQVMRATAGKADPEVVKRLVAEALAGDRE